MLRTNIFAIILLLVITLCAFPQEQKKEQPLSEDRIVRIIQDKEREIEARLKKAQNERIDTEIDKIETRLKASESQNLLLGLGLIFGSLVTGISALIAIFRSVRKKMEQMVEERTSDYLNKLDPRRWEIKIPATGFENEKERLNALGFKRLVPYRGLDAKNLDGISIYHAKSDSDLEILKGFLEEENANIVKCFFIIYCPGDKLSLDLLSPWDNFIPANLSGTLSLHIYNASRRIQAYM